MEKSLFLIQLHLNKKNKILSFGAVFFFLTNI
nr:MAG TPA: hypothetical protein [Caudoviricetes sp.]